MNHQQLDAEYETNGFVCLRGFLDEAEIANLWHELERFLATGMQKMPAHHVFFEDRADAATLKQLQQLGTYDSYFDQIFRQGKFPDAARRALGTEVVPKNLQYFNKPPQVGKATPPHQDGYYFMLSPCRAITMWLALDSADEENGCVRYVQGSHRRGMRNHGRTQTLGFSQGIVDYPTETDSQFEVAMEAKPGDLLIHDALTIHRADANQSLSRSRRALGFIYYSVDAKEDAAAHEKYQQRLAEDLAAQGKI